MRDVWAGLESKRQVNDSSSAARRIDPADVSPYAAAALAAAEEFARTVHPAEPYYRVAFRLARKFKAIDRGDPTQFKDAVEHVCRLCGRDSTVLYDAFFLPAWLKICYAEGEGGLSAHLVTARANLYPCADISDSYRLFVALCYQLSLCLDDRTFFVSRKQLATLLGWPSILVTAYFRYAVGEGLIECVDDSYTFRGKKGAPARSKTYRFIGPDPEHAPSASSAAATMPLLGAGAPQLKVFI